MASIPLPKPFQKPPMRSSSAPTEGLKRLHETMARVANEKNPPSNIPTPHPVVSAIAAKAEAVRVAAAGLTEQIEKIEAFLGELPGRVETYHYFPHPDRCWNDGLEIVLWLHREGKSWMLSCADYHPSMADNDPEFDWKPLKEASLKIKVAAVDAFPDLLTKIEKSQDALIHDLSSAADKAAAFLSAFSTQAKGGR